MTLQEYEDRLRQLYEKLYTAHAAGDREAIDLINNTILALKKQPVEQQ